MTANRKTILLCGGILFTLAILVLLFPVVQGGDTVSSPQRTQLHLQYLVTAAECYRAEYGDWPHGDLARITKTLCGDNDRRLIFLELDRRFTSLRGMPTDAWGTPLRLSFADERVRAESAGKDKTFGTPDDITLTKP